VSLAANGEPARRAEAKYAWRDLLSVPSLLKEQRANALGKLTTFLQFTVVILAILRWRHFELCVATAIAGALAAVSYARRASP
jgi:hypothetical protein